MTYAGGKLEADLDKSHLILSTSSQILSWIELVKSSWLVGVSKLELVSWS